MMKFVSQPELIGHVHWNGNDLEDASGRDDRHLPIDEGKLPSKLHQTIAGLDATLLLEQGVEPDPSWSPFFDQDQLAGFVTEEAGPVRFVMAGQQVGLLTGPLYTILKAVTIIRLAADLEKETNIRHIPLFWMASEDHDLLEVNRCVIGGERFVAGGSAATTPVDRPQVGDVPLEPHRKALLLYLDKVLPSHPQIPGYCQQ